MLADRLKADALDSNIIDEVARRLQLPKEEVEAEDEQPGSLLARLLVALGSASTEPLIPPEATAWNPPNVAPTFDTRKAVLQITQHVIEEAARSGNVVIVGRGGAYILSSFPGALHVFLRAAEAVRVRAIMARFNLASEDEARKRMKQTDENWTSYIKQVYGHDRNHPAHYDMVLDTGRLGYEATVDAILSALKTRKPITSSSNGPLPRLTHVWSRRFERGRSHQHHQQPWRPRHLRRRPAPGAAAEESQGEAERRTRPGGRDLEPRAQLPGRRALARPGAVARPPGDPEEGRAAGAECLTLSAPKPRSG